jgi:diguanylate cyclase (GGDEF)-like protein
MAKILVVDDSPVNRELLAAVLRRAQHQVLEAADGAEALKRVRAERPNLVICDILMPTMDGYEFVRRMRADRDIARTSVIFCTATFLEREARSLAESCGVLRVMTKPLDLKMLPRIVEQAIAQQGSVAIDVLDPLEDTREFDREHVRLVNDKLIERGADLEFANRRLSALTDLNLALASERDPNMLLDRVCRGARELIGSRFSALAVRDLLTGECVRFSTWGLPLEEVTRLGRPLIDSGVFSQVMRESRPKRFVNPGGNPTSIGMSPVFPAVHSALIAPLVSLNHCYGWVFLGDKMGAESFTDEDERLLSIHAAQAGRIYENGTLFAKTNRHAVQQSLVAQFGQQALESTDLDGLLVDAVDVLRRGLDLDYCEILELAGDREVAVYRAGCGWGINSRDRQKIPAGPGTQTRYILEASRQVINTDYKFELDFTPPDYVTAQGIRSAAHVIVNSKTAPIGVISVYAREPGRFAPEDVSFLHSIAHVAETAFARKSAEERMNFLSQFNAITGLPNRSLFLDRLAQTLAQATRGNWLAGVIFVDIDRFKVINDTWGHAAGDRLLQMSAKRLSECVKSGDTVAHVGADEFALVLSKLKTPDDAISAAAKIVEVLAQPFELTQSSDPERVTAYVTGSVGISLFPGDSTDPSALLKNADIAMSRAKELGRNNYQFYLPQMNERALERAHVETGLRVALKNHELLLHFQPKISLRTGEICGFEALLRWQPPNGPMVPPAGFISVLEETGLIESVGPWAVRTVCEQIREWQRRGLQPRPVAVNLSARQFRDKNLDGIIADVIRDVGIDPKYLEFELTESILMQDTVQAAAMLRNLKSLGVSIAVDDFGTGYSSLAYLKKFPLDTLKIDREFVRDCVSDPDDAAIAQSIVSLAHNLGLRVVAEGVETKEQLQYLASVGCDEMQGYYFSKPVPQADCTQMLVEGRRMAVGVPLAMAANQR